MSLVYPLGLSPPFAKCMWLLHPLQGLHCHGAATLTLAREEVEMSTLAPFGQSQCLW